MCLSSGVCFNLNSTRIRSRSSSGVSCRLDVAVIEGQILNVEDRYLHPIRSNLLRGPQQSRVERCPSKAAGNGQNPKG